MARMVVCERHGRSYDAEQHARCPECRTVIGGQQPVETRPSQLDTARREPVRASLSPREALSSRRPDAARTTAQGAPRTTAHGGRPDAARTTAHGGRRPSQLETERPRFEPALRPASTPPNARVYGSLALAWLVLMALLVHRQWWREAP